MWHNPDGSLPFGYWCFQRRVARWQAKISLHDQTGRPIRVTAHQLRHTLGTRLKIGVIATDATFAASVIVAA
jgi:hypothetical protein